MLFITGSSEFVNSQRQKISGVTALVLIIEFLQYCSKTTTSMLYLTLEILDVRTVDADHIASHVGKAVGIVNSLRSIPYNARRNQVLLPADLLLLHGVSEEDIIRKKSTDAVRNLIHDIASQAQIL